MWLRLSFGKECRKNFGDFFGSRSVENSAEVIRAFDKLFSLVFVVDWSFVMLYR